MREILRVLHFWLDMGIDGLRLDAIPYLIERDGTINENLPETHAILKRIRAEMDRHYPDRMLLAEANQWPEDVLPYFGDGDECHMAFHFPVMPRMYMAIAQEDRHPIADILRQTPDIPATCQWGIFLRNHDELTLEMVTDRERDYLWNVYASDRRMRLNLGIRRRLAPLLDNDLRKIQLMNSLLLSMPGTPIVYYGDEIGMGDNIYLGDRDGVRTPMQWSPDRNGGFSRADPARLYLPAIMDPIYGYEAVNVEAQQRDPSSLLNWMKRIIAVRQGHPAFGRGTLRLLYPQNRKIFAYLREHEGDIVLCVVNLARSAQAVELNLAEFKGRVPVELLGRSPFPPIGDLPYMLTLPAYGFYWFVLPEEAELPRWHEELPEAMPDFITLVARDGLGSLVDGQSTRDLTQDVLPAFLAKQRWFAAKDIAISKVRIGAWAEFTTGRDSQLLTEIEVEFAGGEAPQRYFMPLGTSFDEQALTFGWPLLSFSLAQVRRGAKVGALYDGMAAEDFPRAAITAMRAGRELPASAGTIRFSATAALGEVELPDDVEVRRVGVEQSNSSIMLGDQIILKAYRKLAYGVQPELEIGRFLTDEAGYTNTPPLLGAIERFEPDGRSTALAAAFGFVRNQGDGWQYTTEYLHRELERLRLAANAPDATVELEDDDPHGFYLTRAQRARPAHRRDAQGLRDPDEGPGVRRGADHRARPAGLGQGGAQAGRGRVLGAAPCAAAARGGAEGGGRGAAPAAQGLPGADQAAHRAAGQGEQDPAARRLPSRPGAGRPERLLHPRLRGRAGAPARGTPRQDVAAEGRRRHAALVRLRRLVGGADPGRVRSEQHGGRPRAGGALAPVDRECLPRGLPGDHRGLRQLPGGRGRGAPAPRALPPGEGALRDLLRGSQPTRLAHHSDQGGGRPPGYRGSW